jgi:hypothetical protein
MPSTSTDRINGLTTSVAIKPPCKVATTANITLSGEQTIDGVSVVSGDRVLVKDQTDATENGIYVVDTTAWDRAKDFDGNRDVVTGTMVLVRPASSNTLFWECTTANPIIIGTSEITFEAAPQLTPSSYIETLLDDTTAAEARTTLGAASQVDLDAVDDEKATRVIHKGFAYDYSTNTIVVRDGSSDTYHRHFGGVVEGLDGRLHLFYRRASQHGLTSGATIYYSYSNDGGSAWSAETELVAGISGFDQRGMSVCVTPTGRIVVIYDKVVVPSAAPTVMRMVYSDDNGATWAQGSDITTINYAYARAYGRIKLIPGDSDATYRLCWTPYYQSSATPTYRAAVWYSEDDGLTWAEGAAIVDDTAGENEAEMVAINAKVFFAVTRGSSGLTLYKSVNGGSSWSSVGVITGTSSDNQVAPSLDKFKRNGIWYLLIGYCDRSNDDMRFKVANAAEALSSSDAFGGLMIGNTDMVNASGYQALVTKPDGCAYIDGGIAFVEFKEYVGFAYSQVRFVRLDVFALAAETTTPKVLTVASGVVTMPVNEFDVQVTIDTEGGAATDDLDTINGGREGQIVICRGSPGTSSRDVTLKNGTGNLVLTGDFRINTTTSRIVLIKSGASWYELTRSNDHVSTAAGLTISSGVITVPSSRTPSMQLVDTEAAAATDDLDTINGGLDGQIVIFRSSTSSRDPTFKDGTGNMRLSGDFTLSHAEDTITLIKSGSSWYEMSRSDNGA